MINNQKKYWKKADRVVLGATILLIVFGLVAVSLSSVVLSFERFGNNNYYFLRQLLFVAVGLVLLYFVSKIDYHIWQRWARPLFFLGLVLLALVLIPGIGFKPAAARSWFRLGGFLFQPSEFVKLALIFYLSSWFARKPTAQNNFFFGILPPVLITLALIAFVILEPDLGTASMLAIIMIFILFAAGAKFRYLAAMFLAAIAGLWVLIRAAPYRAARIITFIDPSIDPQGIGYHINQALLAIGSGGLWGYGLGGSRQKHDYLPEPMGDSIFAVMAEEIGFFRILAVLLIFAVLAFGILRVARKAPDDFGRLVAIGIACWLGFQTLINIGAISGMLPLTGITLPFVSYGGSSFLANCLAVGVVLNISRQRI